MTNETKIRHYYQSIGLCPRCHGKNKLMGNEKNCPECRANLWAYGVEYKRNHPEYVERVHKSKKERCDYRIENHLCVSCGEPLTDTDFKNCKKCRDRAKYRMRKSRCSSGL